MRTLSLCLLLVGSLALAGLPLQAAPAPQTIGFMGILNDASGGHRNGDLDVTLALYDTDTGGTALWSEQQTVHATNGLFSTALGKSTAFPASLDFSKAYFVGVTVGSDAEMQPRIPLQGVPYALFAQNVADGSVTSAKLASDKDALAKVSGGALTSDGTSVGIGSGAVFGRSTSDTFTYDKKPMGHYGLGWFPDTWNGNGNSAWLSGFGGLKLFTNGQPRLGITQDGNIGVGTMSPDRPLTIQGTGMNGEWLSLKNSSGVTKWHLSNQNGGLSFVESNVADGRLYLKPGGNVGIGTTAPAATLDVNGTVNMTGLSLTSSPGAGKVLTSDANGAGTWQSLPVLPAGATAWQVNGNNIYTTSGSVGIGTSNPARRLDIQDSGTIIANLQSTNTTGTWLNFWNTTGGGTIWHMIATGSGNGEGAGKLIIAPGGVGGISSTSIVLDPAGNTGLGTASPAARLDVRGDIRLGSSGQYFAPSGDQNLTIQYGVVNADGTAASGSSIWAVKGGTGTYSVIFPGRSSDPLPLAMVVTPFSLAAGPPDSNPISLDIVARTTITTQYSGGTRYLNYWVRLTSNGQPVDAPFTVMLVRPR